MNEADLKVGALYFQQAAGNLRLVRYLGTDGGSLKFFVPETAREAASSEAWALSFASADLLRETTVHEVAAILRAFRRLRPDRPLEDTIPPKELPMTPTAPDLLHAERVLVAALHTSLLSLASAEAALTEAQGELFTAREQVDRARDAYDRFRGQPSHTGTTSRAAPFEEVHRDGTHTVHPGATAPGVPAPPSLPRRRSRKKADAPAPPAAPAVPPPTLSLVLGVDVEGVSADMLDLAYFVGDLERQPTDLTPVPPVRVHGVFVAYQSPLGAMREGPFVCTSVGSDATEKRWWRLRPLYSRESYASAQPQQPWPSPDARTLAASQPADPYRGLVLFDLTEEKERVVGPRSEEIEVVLPAPAPKAEPEATLFPEEVAAP